MLKSVEHNSPPPVLFRRSAVAVSQPPASISVPTMCDHKATAPRFQTLNQKPAAGPRREQAAGFSRSQKRTTIASIYKPRADGTVPLASANIQP